MCPWDNSIRHGLNCRKLRSIAAQLARSTKSFTKSYSRQPRSNPSHFATRVMPAIAAISMLSRLKTVGLWVSMIALAALFVLTVWDKLYGVPPMVFEKVGLGQWFRYFTGVLELLGAALLLWPGTAAF